MATLVSQLREGHRNTIFVAAGDLIGASPFLSAMFHDEPTIEALSMMGLNISSVGNHEFDVSQAGLLARNAQSAFHIVSSNVTDVNGTLFPNTVRSAVVPVRAGGRTVRLGLIGLTIDSNRHSWVRYSPAITSAYAAVKELEGKVDCVIAITHQFLADDVQLVTQVSAVDLVLGKVGA